MPDRYDQIVSRLRECDEAVLKNQQEKDAAVASYRKKQKGLNKEIASLNKELVSVIQSNPIRAQLYQTAGRKR